MPMRWSELPLDPPTRTLRQFAGLCVLFLGGLGLWQGLVRERWALAAVLVVLGLTLGGLGLWRPRLIWPVFVGLIIVTWPMGWVVSQVALAILFYGLFVPLGLAFRLLGRDSLRLRQPRTDSYWQAKTMPEDPR